MNDAATQQGATNDGQPAAAPPADPDTALAPEHVPNPRDAILNGMDDRIDAARQEEQRGYLLDNAEELGLDINDPSIPPAAAPVEPDPDADGAQAVQPMHPSAAPAPVAPPEGFEEHEMAQFIVMHQGAPHMKMKVHGVDKLIPMSRVQAQAQKLDAAEVSLQESNRFKKELDQREEAVRQNEAALQTRMDGLTTPPPVTPGVVTEELVAESKEIISTLFRGDEDTAAQGLADLLTRTRAPATAAPAIDTTQIANEAAAVAVSTMTQIDLEKDAVKGLEEFTNAYPEIMADTALYQIADKMTDVIEGEHPEWPPSKLMMEAGKRTTEWLARQRGVTPPDEEDPQPPANLDTNRQERKENLVRIPNPALGAVSPHGGEPEEQVETPHDTIAAIREARGQPAL